MKRSNTIYNILITHSVKFYLYVLNLIYKNDLVKPYFDLASNGAIFFTDISVILLIKMPFQDSFQVY